VLPVLTRPVSIAIRGNLKENGPVYLVVGLVSRDDLQTSMIGRSDAEECAVEVKAGHPRTGSSHFATADALGAFEHNWNFYWASPHL